MSRCNHIRVYISGPITLGDPVKNFAQADEAMAEIMELGYCPLNPMLTMRSQYAGHFSWQQWIDSCLSWVEVADAVLRLPGDSRGAEVECAHAINLGIPVFNGIPELELWRRTAVIPRSIEATADGSTLSAEMLDNLANAQP